MGFVRVLDTNIVIYFLEGRLQEPLEPPGLCVSVMSEIELLSHEKLDTRAEAGIRAFLNSVSVIGLTPQVKEAAIALRRRHRLRVPDAIIAATAIALGAELLSNDARLAAVPGLRCRAMSIKHRT